MIRLIDIVCAMLAGAFALALIVLGAVGALATIATAAGGVIAFALGALLLALLFLACAGAIGVGFAGFTTCVGIVCGTVDLDRLT